MLGRDGSSYNPKVVSKASFPAHRSNEYRAARKRRRFQDGDGVDFSTLILRPKLRYCWSIRWRKTGNRWRVPHLICRCVTLSVTKMALDCSRDGRLAMNIVILTETPYKYPSLTGDMLFRLWSRDKGRRHVSQRGNPRNLRRHDGLRP